MISVLLIICCISTAFPLGKRSSSSGSRPFDGTRDRSASERPVLSSIDPEVKEGVRMAEEERLQKLISRAGLASRRAAEQLILDGRVTVNGKLITTVGVKVHTLKDVVLVDGEKLNLPDAKSILWVALHKPRGMLTTMDDEKDRDTIHTLIPKAKDLRLLPVGRLDRDTTGVIILTNENGWIHPLTHPSFVHKRRYEVVVQGIPTEDAINALQKGPILPGDEISIQPCIIRLVEVDTNAGLSLIDMSIEENFPMQVQRMVEFLKCEMINLKRIEFGPIKLKGLRRGEWRELTQVEIERLKGSCVKSGSVPPKRKLRSRLFRTKKPGSGYSNRTSGDDKAEPKSYQTDPRRRRSAEPTARGDQGERKSPQQSWVSKTKQAGTVEAQELRPRNPTKRTGGEQVNAKSYQVDPRKRRDGASEGKGSRDERNGAWPQQGEERKSTGRR